MVSSLPNRLLLALFSLLLLSSPSLQYPASADVQTVSGRVFKRLPAPGFQTRSFPLPGGPAAISVSGDFDGNGAGDLLVMLSDRIALLRWQDGVMSEQSAPLDGRVVRAAAAGRFLQTERDEAFILFQDRSAAVIQRGAGNALILHPLSSLPADFTDCRKLDAAYLRGRPEPGSTAANKRAAVACLDSKRHIQLAVPDESGEFHFPAPLEIPDLFGVLPSLLVFDHGGDGRDDLVVFGKGESLVVFSGTDGESPVTEPVSTQYFWGETPRNLVPAHLRPDLSRTVHDLLILKSNSQIIGSIPGEDPPYVWDELLPRLPPDLFLSGDFDGDGLTDLLIHQEDGRECWLMLTDRFTGRKFSVPLAPAPGARLDAITAADIDGDGTTELLSAGTDQLLVQYPQMTQPIQNAEIVIENLHDGKRIDPPQHVRSDPDGRFSFELPPTQQPGTVRFSSPGYRLDAAEIPAEQLPLFLSGMNRPGIKLRLVPPPLARPLPCVGVAPGSHQKWGALTESCPPGYSVLAVDDPSGRPSNPSEVSSGGTCCPLPAADILGEESVEVTGSCPEGMIVTGTKYIWTGDSAIWKLHCTSLNRRRYQLGPKTPGIYWGYGFSLAPERISRRSIPVGLRIAIGRYYRNQWDVDGCLGQPFGSILTGKSVKHCSGFTFQELQYAGAGSDPPAGTPVKMFPDCSEVRGVFENEAICIP